ncbi:MAG: hypothetical protein GXP02_03400 [Alphaproteobacteria bacterium]|nr:hypothetical protein [Alphaproteobacteria bacterium]
MKLRIDPERISFRLDLEQAKTLLERGKFEQATPLPDGEITSRIICLPAGSEAGFQAGDNVFTLSLARDVIEDHIASLPSLHGIVTQFSTAGGNSFEVALEINLKKKLKRSLKSRETLGKDE